MAAMVTRVHRIQRATDEVTGAKSKKWTSCSIARERSTGMSPFLSKLHIGVRGTEASARQDKGALHSEV